MGGSRTHRGPRRPLLRTVLADRLNNTNDLVSGDLQWVGWVLSSRGATHNNHRLEPHHRVRLEVIPVIADLVQITVTHAAVLHVDENLRRCAGTPSCVTLALVGATLRQQPQPTSLSPTTSDLKGIRSSLGPLTRAPIANCSPIAESRGRLESARCLCGPLNLQAYLGKTEGVHLRQEREARDKSGGEGEKGWFKVQD